MLRTERKTEQKVIELQEALKQADTILIGAGAGLSASAGFAYGGEQFHRYFADFEEKYGFHDMYSGGFYPFPTLEEHWAYWSRFVFLNRYCDPPKPVYQNLLELVKDKDYFVLTTNVDHCFQKVGFDKCRLFYTQGDYGLWQCSRPCHDKAYDNQQHRLAEWSRRVEACRSSGLPVGQWCQENGIAVSTYFSWQRKVFQALKEVQEVTFAEVPIMEHSQHSGHIIAAMEVSDVRIQVYAGADKATLQAILQAAKSC